MARLEDKRERRPKITRNLTNVAVLWRTRQPDFNSRWASVDLPARRGGRSHLGDQRANLPLFGHLAVGHQHRHHDRDLPNGLPDPKLAKPR